MNKYKTQEINKEKIKVIPTTTDDPKSILGYDIIPRLYANIFICAQKRSGKTNVIHKILEKCINKETGVFVFAATHDIDENWKFIKQEFEKKGIKAVFFSAIEEGKTNNLQGVLDFMKNSLVAETDEKKQDKLSDLIQVVKFDYNTKKTKIKVKAPKKKSPKFMIIFDDMTTELKNKDIGKLLKTFRHYKSKVIVSTQWPNDLKPEARKQIGFFLLFGGHIKEKLEQLYKDMGISDISFDKFYEIYTIVTREKYQFLDVNQHTGELRKNFNEKIILNNSINESKN